MIKVKPYWLVLVFLFLPAYPPFLAAEEIRVSSSVDKRVVTTDEEIHLTIRVTGAKVNVQAPRLPESGAFDTFYTGRASHITFVNGQSSSSVEFSYVLVPRETGRAVLGPIEVDVAGQPHRIEPIEIEVRQGTSQKTQSWAPPPQAPSAITPPVQEPPPPVDESADENIFIRAWLDKAAVYPNEQVLLTYSLYTRYDTRYEGFAEEPEISGFWIEEFPPEREVQRETVRVGGKRYVKADVRKVALFPTEAGDYTIPPGSIKVSIRREPQSTGIFDEFFSDSFFAGGGFFSRRESRLLSPAAVSLAVRPFPKAGKPKSFEGAVGQFRLSATVDKQAVKQNEPVTLQLVIEGEGNIETLKRPQMPELEEFKIYDGDSTSQLYKTGNVIGGRKTFEIVFIPTRSGPQRIPRLEFSFLDPATGIYQRLYSSEFPLTVEPSDQRFELPKALSREEALKKEIRLEGKDIRFIEERMPVWDGARATRTLVLLLGGLNILLTFMVLVGEWQQRQQRIFAKDSALRRRRFARSQAESRMRHLKKLLHAEDPKQVADYFEELEKTLTQYLSDKFNLSAHGITRADLERHLESSFGVQDPLFREILALFEDCEQARFARASIPQGSREKALKILRETIVRVERKR